MPPYEETLADILREVCIVSQVTVVINRPGQPPLVLKSPPEANGRE